MIGTFGLWKVDVLANYFKKGKNGEWNSRDLTLRKKLKKVKDFVARFSNNKTKKVL
jgi:hypothetical protein